MHMGMQDTALVPAQQIAVWGQQIVQRHPGLERPVVLLTSDPDDMSRLAEVPERPKTQRIAVIRV
jgi:hypothetical protein